MLSDQPNIVRVTLHDLGANLNCYNELLPETPAITRLANEGVVFDNHFSTCPLCSPARASIQTGRYPHSAGMNGLTHRGFALNDDEQCLPQYLNDCGYHTALFGLQHEAHDNLPRLGYQEIWQTPDGQQHSTDVIPAAVDFLHRKHKNPFLLSVGFRDVHLPFEYPFIQPVNPEEVCVPAHLTDCPEVRQSLAWFHGYVQTVDRGMEKLLDALDRTGQANNTLIFFTTDHGFAFPRAKSTLYDPGIHVALIARWPEHIKPNGRIKGLTSHVDMLPAILEILGQPDPERVQGRSFLPLLEDPDQFGNDCIFAEKSWHGNEYDPMRCIRTGEFKYIRNFTEGWLYQTPLDIKLSPAGRAMEESRKHDRPMTELYHLPSDPDEFHNLSGHPEYAASEAELDSRLLQWMENTGDMLPDKHIPWPQPGKEHYLNNKDCPIPQSDSRGPAFLTGVPQPSPDA